VGGSFIEHFVPHIHGSGNAVEFENHGARAVFV
jgi:hypothetical protein